MFSVRPTRHRRHDCRRHRRSFGHAARWHHFDRARCAPTATNVTVTGSSATARQRCRVPLCTSTSPVESTTSAPSSSSNATRPLMTRAKFVSSRCMHPRLVALVSGAAPGNDRHDTCCLDLPAVLVVIGGAISEHRVRPTPGDPHRRKGMDQGHELGDIVAVAAGQRHLRRDTVPFGDQMAFRAGSGTVDRARSGFGPPSIARTCEPSTTALDQSSAPAACSSASRFSYSRVQTAGVVPVPQPWDDRQQRLDACPQLVGHDPRWLLSPASRCDQQPR